MPKKSSMTHSPTTYRKNKPDQAKKTDSQTSLEAIRPLPLKAEAQKNVLDEAIFHKYAIIVEGPTDRTYERFLDSGRAFIVLPVYELIPQGRFARQAVIDYVRRGGKVKGYTQILGIVDSDFSRVKGCRGPVKEDQVQRSRNEPIFTTDTHDLEMMIMDSDDFADLLTREMKRNWKTTLGKTAQQERKKLLADALLLGYVSYLSRRLNIWKGITTELKKTKVEIFYQHGKLNLEKLAEFVAAFTGNRVRSEEIKVQIETCIKSHHPEDDWQICNGHYCSNILSHRMKEAIRYRDDEWERKIRESYGVETFKKTELYEAIKEYVRRNNWNPVFQ